jgi:hypothetical protein
MLTAAWILVCAIGAGYVARRMLVEAAREREAARVAEPFEGLADIGPADVLDAIGRLADVPGVRAVYAEPDSNVIWLLAEDWLEADTLQLVKEEAKYAVPFGLSARVVQKRAQMPDACTVVARGWGLKAAEAAREVLGS